MPLEKLTRIRIVEALNALGQLAKANGVQLELCLYGGSALLLAYDSRTSTKDVDAIVKPSDTGRHLAGQVAEKLQLDENWLNDSVKQFVSDFGTFAPLNIEELEETAKKHLKITRASAAYLLAMKSLACRPPMPGYPGDVEDIRFLLKKMGIDSMEQIEEQVARFYPFDAVTPAARNLIETLLPPKEP
jgi:hypothetical protein